MELIENVNANVENSADDHTVDLIRNASTYFGKFQNEWQRVDYNPMANKAYFNVYQKLSSSHQAFIEDKYAELQQEKAFELEGEER